MGLWNVIRDLVIGILIFVVLATPLVHPTLLGLPVLAGQVTVGQVAVWVIAIVVGVIVGYLGKEGYWDRVVDGLFVGAAGTIVSYVLLSVLVTGFDIATQAMTFLSYLVIDALLCGLGTALAGFLYGKRAS